MNELSKEDAERELDKRLREWDEAQKRYKETYDKYAASGFRIPRQQIQFLGKVSDEAALKELQQALQDVTEAQQRFIEAVRRYSIIQKNKEEGVDR